MSNKINTSFIYPPIPWRQFDWSATRDNYEPGDHIGYGETEQAATADLIELEDEEPEPPPFKDRFTGSYPDSFAA